MLDQLFIQQFTNAIDITAVLVSMLASLGMGLVFAGAYFITHRDLCTKNGFGVTIMVIPAIITLIILLIGDNVARAFSLAGSLAIIRFRSIAEEPLDMAYTFSALGIGLACGMGYFGYAAVFTVIISAVFVIAHFVKKLASRKTQMILKIVIPEDMNYADIFDDVLSKHTEKYKLLRVKTADFGTVFEITYSVVLKEDSDQKEFLDELRRLNGNLNISLCMSEAVRSYE